jgi:NADH-quinone oxidoreductase subunit L
MLYGGWFEGASLEDRHHGRDGARVPWRDGPLDAARVHHGAVLAFDRGVATAWFFYINAPGSRGCRAQEVRRAGERSSTASTASTTSTTGSSQGGARKVGAGLWKWGDKTIIDGIMVNGTARLIGVRGPRGACRPATSTTTRSR